MEEIFKPVVGFIGEYEVSNLGRVKSLKRRVNTKLGKGYRFIPERILSSPDRGNGYLFVDLRAGNKKRQASVHQLVAEAFIPNPDSKPQVNHINGIKSDNRVENLEWVTPSENAKHTYDKLGRIALSGANDPKSKKVYQQSIGGEVVKIWDNGKVAERIGGFCSSNISACANGKHKTHAGYVWRYEV